MYCIRLPSDLIRILIYYPDESNLRWHIYRKRQQARSFEYNEFIVYNDSACTPCVYEIYITGNNPVFLLLQVFFSKKNKT